MPYSRAWQCKWCPERGGPKGCPAWWEMVEENPQTGETRVSRECGFAMLPRLLLGVIKAGEVSATEVSGTKTVIARGFDALGQALPQAVLQAAAGAGHMLMERGRDD